MSADRESPRLYGRQAECERLAKLVDGVRGGSSAVLVVHGKPGTGKTALLDFTAGLDNSLKAVQVAGAESETELASGGLHRLRGTMLDLLGRLPYPQREAVEIAFGRQAGTGPVNARFLHERLPHSKLDVIDVGHFPWEDATTQYPAPVTSWWHATARGSRT
jgi:hypothetical protein